LPSASIEINRAWCVAATIATDLLAWLRLLCLDGPLAKAEPKTLRYRLLRTATHIVRGQRKRKIRIPETWPCAPYLAACPHAALAMPHRPDAQSASSHPQPPKGSTRTRGTRRPPEARVGTPAQRITGDCVIAGVCVRCLLRNALATPGVISAA
jgi:hypothetical protein